MNVLYLLTTATQIQTAPILMDLFCVLVMENLQETKLFAKVTTMTIKFQFRFPFPTNYNVKLIVFRRSLAWNIYLFYRDFWLNVCSLSTAW